MQLIIFVHTDDCGVEALLFAVKGLIITAVCVSCRKMRRKVVHDGNSLIKVFTFGNKDEVLKVNAYLDSRGQTTKNQVRNLGVILETDLSFSSVVNLVLLKCRRLRREDQEKSDSIVSRILY